MNSLSLSRQVSTTRHCCGAPAAIATSQIGAEGSRCCKWKYILVYIAIYYGYVFFMENPSNMDDWLVVEPYPSEK